MPGSPIIGSANTRSRRKQLASELTANHLDRDAAGEVAAPDAPGLGIAVDVAAARRYLQEVEIKVNGRVLYATPALS